jgi:hypothetical protein
MCNFLLYIRRKNLHFLPLKRRKWRIMNDDISQPLRTLLAEKLADSLAMPFPAATPRRLHGTVSFLGKATAVIGMRRAGKTTFPHQLRRERHEHGIERVRLPYINFEDERLAELRAQDLHLRFPTLRGREPAGSALSGGCSIPKRSRCF